MTDALACPRCRVALEPFALDGATAIDLCPSCKGAWFDRGELARVVGTPRDLLDTPAELPPANADALLCPCCPGVCMVRLPYSHMNGAPRVDHCPYCEGVWAPIALLATLRQFADMRPRTRPHAAVVVTKSVRAPPRRSFNPDAPPDPPLTLRQCALGVPIAFGVVAIVRLTFFGTFMLHGVRVSLHELGHALAAWACGWMAVPTPVGVTFTYPGRSLVVHVFVLAACGAGAWVGVRQRARALTVVSAAYALASLVCTWGLATARQHALESFCGCAGEMVLGALLVVLSFCDMPAAMRWGRFRWVALSLGACSFVGAALFWREAARDWDLIPWDAALADTGDMTRLKDDHGWTEAMITGRYTALAWLCLAAVITAQGVACAVAWRRRRGA